jgi:hypothetical protein
MKDLVKNLESSKEIEKEENLKKFVFTERKFSNKFKIERHSTWSSFTHLVYKFHKGEPEFLDYISKKLSTLTATPE